MLHALRSLTVLTCLVAAAIAQAEECATSGASLCGGTCPDGYVCALGTSGTPCECDPGLPFTEKKLAVKLNFAKPLSDNVVFKAGLPVADGFVRAGRMVTVDVGGIVRTFVLDSKGKAKSDGTELKLAVTSKKGHVAAQDAQLFFKGAKATWADELSDEGFVDATVETTLAIHVEVHVDGALYAKTVTLGYQATKGKTGKAK
jgi:hypothetical protein